MCVYQHWSVAIFLWKCLVSSSSWSFFAWHTLWRDSLLLSSSVCCGNACHRGEEARSRQTGESKLWIFFITIDTPFYNSQDCNPTAKQVMNALSGFLCIIIEPRRNKTICPRRRWRRRCSRSPCSRSPWCLWRRSTTSRRPLTSTPYPWTNPWTDRGFRILGQFFTWTGGYRVRAVPAVRVQVCRSGDAEVHEYCGGSRHKL